MSFDGYTWSRGDAQSFRPAPIGRAGLPVDYTVTLEPTGQQFLFALDLVDRWTPGVAGQSWDYGLRTRKPVNSVLRYDARSYRAIARASQLSLSLRQCKPAAAVEPQSADRGSRSQHAGAKPGATKHTSGPCSRCSANRQFFYTLTPPGLARDSVDDFLFNTRQGFCGHFASAFTTMMRAAGIPARVVAGYQGGDWNPIGGYLLVRQSHAHAWSEVWLPGRAGAASTRRPRSRRSASNAASRRRLRAPTCCRARSCAIRRCCGRWG